MNTLQIAQSAPPADLLGAVAIGVVVMLLGFAVEALRNVVTRLWCTARALLRAVFAIVLASGALALTAGVLVLGIHLR